MRRTPLVLIPLLGLVILFSTVAGFLRPPASDHEVQFTRIRSGPHVSDTASSPSASWIDIDLDGDEDLYVLNGYGSLEDPPIPQRDRLYENDGRGGYSEVASHPLVDDVTFSGSSSWADYDNDGDVDVFVASQRNARNRLFRKEGDGSFVRVVDGPVAADSGRSFSAAWVDMDNDGWLDLHVMNGRDGDEGQEDYVYRNLRGERFERVDTLAFARERLPTGGAAWADFDEDGDADLFLPINSTSHSNRLYLNRGSWRFTEVTDRLGAADDPLPYSPRSSVAHWIDADGDLNLDLFVGNTPGVIDYLFRNDGAGAFERVVAGRIGLDATYVSDVIWADVDNDADLDVVLGVWGAASELYRNDGTGRFFPAPARDFGSEIAFVSSVSAADVEGDGDLDLYMTQWPINEAGGAPNQFYRNDTQGGNWIKIDLEGTDSNRSGIGAAVIVTVKVGGRQKQQMRYVTSRTSWRSTSSLTQHFGLGAADAVERIEVRWPSGRVDTVDGPFEPNQRLRIVEG